MYVYLLSIFHYFGVGCFKFLSLVWETKGQFQGINRTLFLIRFIFRSTRCRALSELIPRCNKSFRRVVNRTAYKFHTLHQIMGSLCNFIFCRATSSLSTHKFYDCLFIALEKNCPQTPQKISEFKTGACLMSNTKFYNGYHVTDRSRLF